MSSSSGAAAPSSPKSKTKRNANKVVVGIAAIVLMLVATAFNGHRMSDTVNSVLLADAQSQQPQQQSQDTRRMENTSTDSAATSLKASPDVTDQSVME